MTGENGQAAEKLYVVAGIYLAASIFWWFLFRRIKLIYVLSLPFALYGLAFFILGMGPYASNAGGKGWIYNVATVLYAIASASGSLFFTLNFGSEGMSSSLLGVDWDCLTGCIGGTPVETWAFRACVIQGTQQLYVAVLWYWGSQLTSLTTAGVTSTSLVTSSRAVTAITTPIAVIMWAVGLILYLGLPNYYRQEPGKVPSFYRALLRRKIILVSTVGHLHQYGQLTVISVVLCHGPDTELLALCSVWSQLAISLVQPTYSRLVRRPAPSCLLRWYLGYDALDPWIPFPTTLLGPPHLRHRPRRTPLGADALGNIKHRPLRAHR